MYAPGTVWAGMLGLQFSRFDRLLVYGPLTQIYIDVMDALRGLQDEIDRLQILDTGRLDAIEAKNAFFGRTDAAKGYEIRGTRSA